MLRILLVHFQYLSIRNVHNCVTFISPSRCGSLRRTSVLWQQPKTRQPVSFVVVSNMASNTIKLEKVNEDIDNNKKRINEIYGDIKKTIQEIDNLNKS